MRALADELADVDPGSLSANARREVNRLHKVLSQLTGHE